MTCGRRTVLTVVSVLMIAAVDSVVAQQTAQTPRPESRAVAQGFSVVLVLADLAAASAVQDDVPAAARRALADMKDFLPYKSYKLLDAAWILGGGGSGTTTRLRGLETQEYELVMHTSMTGHNERRGLSESTPQGAQRSNPQTVFVRFSLSEGISSVEHVVAEVDAARAAEEASKSSSQTTIRLYQQEVARLEKELRAVKQRFEAGTADQSKISEAERQLFEARARLARAQEGRTPRPSTRFRTGSRPVIDTSFNMEVGETVVVGTSRLKGNSRALIALLTAVPARSSTSR